MRHPGVYATSRRSLLRASAAAWLGASLPSAKPQNPTRRVALLGIVEAPTPPRERFRSRLAELGWVEGKNLILDIRFTQGDGARIAPLTTELLALQPDAFVAPFDTMAIGAAAFTTKVPVVFAVGTDPIGYGLVASLSHPVATSPASAAAARNSGRSGCRFSRKRFPG